MAGYISKVNIPQYNSGQVYEKYDLVQNSGYYVSFIDGNLNNIPTGSDSNWKKFGDYNLDIKDLWQPSYDSANNYSPIIKEIRLDNGYTDRAQNGLNDNKFNFEANYLERSEKEAQSLVAFLEFMGSKYAFKYTVPIYNESLSFVAKNYKIKYDGFDRFSITAIFEESFNPIVSSGESQPFLV